MSDTTDWQGRLVPPDEPDDKVIKVWQVTPHPGGKHLGDSAVWRSWHDMRLYVKGNLEELLERDEVMGDGLTLTFKVVEMTVGDYREIVEGSGP